MNCNTILISAGVSLNEHLGGMQQPNREVEQQSSEMASLGVSMPKSKHIKHKAELWISMGSQPIWIAVMNAGGPSDNGNSYAKAPPEAAMAPVLVLSDVTNREERALLQSATEKSAKTMGNGFNGQFLSSFS